MRGKSFHADTYGSRLMELAKERKIQVDEVYKGQIMELRKQIATHYRSDGWLEEDIRTWNLYTSDLVTEIYHPDDQWELTKKFLSTQSEIVVYYPGDPRQCAYHIHKGDDAHRLISNVFVGAFDFYVTNERFEFMLYHFHDGTLAAGGTAKPWLEDLLNQVFLLIDVEPQPIGITSIDFEDFFHHTLLTLQLANEPMRQFRLRYSDCGGFKISRYIRNPRDSERAKVYHLMLDTDLGPHGSLPFQTCIYADRFNIRFSYHEVTSEPITP